MRKRRLIKLSKDFKTFWMTSILVAGFLLTSAVLQLNMYIHQNSLAKDFNKQINTLTAQAEMLEVQLSSKNSLANFNKYVEAQALNFEKVEVERIKYIKAFGDQLARK